MSKQKKVETKPKYWYKVTVYSCSVCGSEEVVRWRQYTPKPEDPRDRREVIESYYWCNHWG